VRQARRSIGCCLHNDPVNFDGVRGDQTCARWCPPSVNRTRIAVMLEATRRRRPGGSVCDRRNQAEFYSENAQGKGLNQHDRARGLKLVTALERGSPAGAPPNGTGLAALLYVPLPLWRRLGFGFPVRPGPS